MRKVLSIRQVCALLFVSRATIHRKVASGKFPPFFPLFDRGTNALGKPTGRIGWYEDVVLEWIAKRDKLRSP